ncbi:PspC domain-containing protein [Candidatus Leptofilum sp.]|uniref:PspC domain-containing protein n=1 Tax=Candidatus Leptofilum sp. TaxID=3241576 RepID=UPI003B5BE48C
MSDKRLVRNSHDEMIGGVCSGIANYLNIDPVIVRLVFVLLALGGGHGVLAYLILWVLMPTDGEPVAKANAFDEEEIVIN